METVKYCRICLEEGVLTSIFNTEFAMMPAEMIMLCAKVKIYKNDGMPGVICNNCIYRLGVAYHFKQQAENSDLRLRQYFNLMDKGYGTRDAEVNTEAPYPTPAKKNLSLFDDDDEDDDESTEKIKKVAKPKSKRYKRKAPEEKKKRGPKPMPRPPQTCYQCNKSFRCRAQLQLHIRTHSGEKPFACEFCTRSFAQKHNLTIHLRTHTGYKPYQCDVCSKQFSALGNFQQHKKIHDGVRDQICPVCNKAFLTNGDLSRHIATHTGIKNHHCDTCGKSFTRNRDMVAHQKKIHLNQRSEENLKCPECHKVFATLERLNEHFRTHGTEAQSLHSITAAQQVTAPVVAPPPAPPPAPVPIHNQPGSIDHLLNTPTIPHAPVGSSLAILAPPGGGLGMIPAQGHLGMMHHPHAHPHQRMHPY